MYHYVYRLDDYSTGEYYYGSRSCKCKPAEDPYMGSMSRWKPDRSKLNKTIIKDDFCDRKEAVLFERDLIIESIKDVLNRNYAIPGKSSMCYTAFGPKNHFYGKKHTEETKRKWKMSRPNKIGENNPMWGKHFSEETKEKMRQKKAGVYDGAKNPRARKLYQYAPNGSLLNVWDCAKDCIDHYEKLGVSLSKGNVSSRANINTEGARKLLKLGGFIFSFAELATERFENEMIAC